jgi:tetratricopeptide (TPR) repeat protein
LDAAEARYRAAAAADPRNARAQYNLGVVLEDRGEAARAIEAYLGALGLDADLAAAHFNVSRLLQDANRRTEAIGHLTEYKRLVKRGDVGS